MNRTTTVIIGVVLVLVAVGGFALLGNLMNPPATDILVAVEDIAPGEILQPYMVNVISVRSADKGQAYVTTDNVDTYANAMVIDQIYAGQYIPKAALSHPENPAAESRIALALNDPELVAMVVPVDPETSPQQIVVGDRVDLVLAVGSAAFLSGNFDVVPEPDQTANDFYAPTFGLALADPTAMAGEPTSPLDLDDGTLTLDAPYFPIATSTPTPNPQRITLPVAKTITVEARVLHVAYELIVNATFNPDSNAPETVKGDIRALVLAVPRQAQEIVAFGVSNSALRIAVLDPLANTPEDAALTPGMSWDDLVAFFKWERAAWAEAQDGDTATLEQVPGAAALVPTLSITPQSIPVGEGSPTPTVVLDSVDREADGFIPTPMATP